MKNPKDRVRFPLSRKIAVMIMAVVLAVSLFIFAVSYVLYARKMNSFYDDYLLAISDIISRYYDEELVEEWFSEEMTAEEEELYDSACEMFRIIGSEFGLSSMSIVRSEDGAVRYAIDLDFSGNDEETYSHGELVPGKTKFEMCNELRPVKGLNAFIRGEEWRGISSVLLSESGESYGYLDLTVSFAEENKYLRQVALQMFLMICGLGLLMSLIPVLVTSRRVAGPIRALSAGALQLTEAKQDSETTETAVFQDLKISSRDEIGILYRSLSRMEQDMNAYTQNLMKVTAESERVRTELELAAAIQENQLPRTFPPFPDREEFEIYASMKPAKSVGGDFYDFYLVDDDHIALVMADVSGKGIPAALFMMISRILIKTYAQNTLSPAEILNNVNGQLTENNMVDMFVTVWLAILELSTGEGVVTNAGHEFPVVRRAGGAYEMLKYKHSPPVGAMRGVRFSEHTFRLDPGDSLFVYTDGVPEARKESGEFFGNDRLVDVLNRVPGASPEELVGNVLEEVLAFSEGAEQFDDITMLNLLYRGKT